MTHHHHGDADVSTIARLLVVVAFVVVACELACLLFEGLRWLWRRR